MRRSLLILSVLLVAVLVWFGWPREKLANPVAQVSKWFDNSEGGGLMPTHPLSIASMRDRDYSGSEIVIEEELAPGSNYQRYLVSYQSDGLKIYALLTVPDGNPPPGGWPAIIFNHGYIPPDEYKTTEKYLAYTDGFSRNGYVLFRPDFRGHGNSDGEPSGAYGSPDYVTDALNAVSSVKKLDQVNPDKIGMWGHSMGGHVMLRSMVVSSDIKAGVIWAGVVASYPDLINNWRRRNSSPPPGVPPARRRWREELVSLYGTPETNPSFWSSISANSFLGDVSGPIALHHGTADASVPVEFSRQLKQQLDDAGKPSELFTYEGDDHNLSKNFSVVMKRSVEFFDQYLKGGE
jgi:dipeptidyl aminopeptidase/acylaminoacyl peptidase